MTEPEYGYPDFIIKGSPDEIRNRTGIMRDRASDFETLGDSLRSVTGGRQSRFRWLFG